MPASSNNPPLIDEVPKIDCRISVLSRLISRRHSWLKTSYLLWQALKVSTLRESRLTNRSRMAQTKTVKQTRHLLKKACLMSTRLSPTYHSPLATSVCSFWWIRCYHCVTIMISSKSSSMCTHSLSLAWLVMHCAELSECSWKSICSWSHSSILSSLKPTWPSRKSGSICKTASG